LQARSAFAGASAVRLEAPLEIVRPSMFPVFGALPPLHVSFMELPARPSAGWIAAGTGRFGPRATVTGSQL